jgi:hypothetical protein
MYRQEDWCLKVGTWVLDYEHKSPKERSLGLLKQIQQLRGTSHASSFCPISSTIYSLITLNNGDICNIVMLRFWTLNGFGHCFFFIINVDVRASLRAP